MYNEKDEKILKEPVVSVGNVDLDDGADQEEKKCNLTKSYWCNLKQFNNKDPNQKKLTEEIYKEFKSKKIDVLLDDRDDRAGVKFKDADLIGIPFQIVIGRDSIDKKVELICRKNNTKFKISSDKLLETFISESEIMYNKKS